MASKFLVVMLCVGLLGYGAAGSESGTRRLLQQPSWFTDSTWTQNSGSAGSGSSGSSSASSSSSVSTNGGSGSASSSSSSAVTQAAASACASSLSDAFAAGSVCGSTAWAFDKVQVAASACANALVSVALSGTSSSYASGNTQSCADSHSSVQADARALAKSAADAVASACGQCEQVKAYIYSDDFASVFVDVCASALTNACSSSHGSGSSSAYASVYGILHTMASSLASVFGKAYSAACVAGCGAYSSCGSCPYSSYDSAAVSNTMVTVTEGKYVATTGMADAVAKACGDHQYNVHAEEVARTCTETCLSAYYSLHGEAWSTSGSRSCAKIWVDAELKAIASASLSIAAGAMASNWGNTCADVVAVTQASITAIDVEKFSKLIIDVFDKACTNNGGSASINDCVTEIASSGDLVNVLANSWASSNAHCLCNNPGCCSSCQLASSCPAVPKP